MPTEYRPLEPSDTCKHFDHDPATMVMRKPGHYKHTCPACGHVQEFTIYPVTC